VETQWEAERAYWWDRLRNILRTTHPLQSDDTTVPSAKLVNQIQNPKKAQPDVYFATAYRHAVEFLSELDRHGFDYRRFDRVLEFGVGSGRLLRQFIPLGWKLYGCDITPDLVSFASRVLNDHAQIRLTGAPPLPYENEYFDFVYAVSVFTHIQHDDTPAWVEELRRIIRPGGALIVTVFEANQYLPLAPRELDAVENGPGYYEWGSSDVTERFIFMTPEKLRDTWRSFDVLELRPRLRDQSHLIMRRR
jgi:SAM-dependent methyltransferase